MGRPRNAERAAIAERRAKVLQFRIEQVPYAEIARQLGVSEDVAESDYRRAVEQRRTALDSARTAAVAIEEAKLDAMEQAVWEVLRRRHVTVSQGRIVGRYTGRFLRDEDGEIIRDGAGKPMLEVEEIEDDAPVLQASDRLVKIAERRARLKGHDAPVKVDVRAEVDDEIAAIAAALAGGVGELEPAGEAEAAGDAEAG
jgi:DNA-binding GntR family transcriptional regulator